MATIKSFFRFNNPHNQPAIASLSGQNIYAMNQRTEVGHAFYRDYLSDQAYPRLIFALRLGWVRLDGAEGAFDADADKAYEFSIVFTMSGSTIDGFVWNTRYRLTLSNYNWNHFDPNNRYDKRGFRIDSYNYGELDKNRLKLNGFTHSIRAPDGTEKITSYLTCHTDDPRYRPNLDKIFLDINISPTSQFYLFDLFLSDNETSHFGLNGALTNGVFKKTDLILFDEPPIYPLAPNTIEFKCEYFMPGTANVYGPLLTIDVTNIWMALAGKDTKSLNYWDVANKLIQYYDDNPNANDIFRPSEIKDLGRGSLMPNNFLIIDPIFYINGGNGARNEVDHSPIDISAPTSGFRLLINQTVYLEAPPRLPNIPWASGTNYTFPVMRLAPSMSFTDTGYDIYQKTSTVYTDSCSDSSKICINCWVYVDRATVDFIFIDDKDPDPKKHYFCALFVDNYDSVVTWGPVHDGGAGRTGSIPPSLINWLEWNLLTIYIDIVGDKTNICVNGVQHYMGVYNYALEYTYFFSRRTTFTIGMRTWSHTETKDAFGNIHVYCASTMAKHPEIPWSDAPEMQKKLAVVYNLSNGRRVPPQTSTHGYTIDFRIKPDFYINPQNLGVFGNSAYGTFCLGNFAWRSWSWSWESDFPGIYPASFELVYENVEAFLPTSSDVERSEIRPPLPPLLASRMRKLRLESLPEILTVAEPVATASLTTAPEPATSDTTSNCSASAPDGPCYTIEHYYHRK